MDTIALIILVIIISIISSTKKKAQQEAAKAKKVVYTAPAKKAEPVTLDSAWEVPRMETVVTTAPTMGTEGTDACHEYMLPPTQPQPILKTLENHAVPAPVIGREGMDACHEFMLNETPVSQPAAQTDTGLSPEEARDLMRGIILSEIMARPRQRFAGRRR